MITFDGGKITISAGTVVSASLYYGALSLSFAPPITVAKNWVPVNVYIHSAQWSFSSAEFKIDARGAGPDSLYSWISTTIANKYFKTFVPAAIARPGYSLSGDPNLEGTIESIKGDVLGKMAAGGQGSQATSVGLSDIADPSVSLSLRLVSSDVEIPLAAQKATVTLAAGTTIRLQGSARGTLANPRLGEISISFDNTPISIKMAEGTFKELTELRLRSITVLPGAKLRLGYDLAAEDAATGLKALFGVVALAAGDGGRTLGGITPARLDVIRKMIDEKVSAAAEPMIAATIRQYDAFVPGYRLSSIAGL